MLSWKRREKLDSENRFVFCASISYALGLFYRCFAERRKDDGAVRSDAEDSSVVQNEVRYFKGSIRMQLWCDDIWKVEASVRKNCWNC